MIRVPDINRQRIYKIVRVACQHRNQYHTKQTDAEAVISALEKIKHLPTKPKKIIDLVSALLDEQDQMPVSRHDPFGVMDMVQPGER